jgi:WD40 repeat protein
MEFGPGISVDFSRDGRHLAVGGYRWDARVLTLNAVGIPIQTEVLESPNHGVVKSIAFAADGTLLVASGDGCLVVHRFEGEKWRAVGCYRANPPMELSNGVAASPDSRRAYIVSRDQSLRVFDLDTGVCLGTGLAHTRSVKSVHMSECGRYLVTGGYDRMVLVWDPNTLQVRLPPLRGANSGVSCVRVQRGLITACSFDGVVSVWSADNGEMLWTKTNHDASRGA